MYLSPAHYGGKLHVIINVIFSLLVLFSLWTDCICECRSAKHFKMKKKPGTSFESDFTTLRQSLNTVSRCFFFFSLIYPRETQTQELGSSRFLRDIAVGNIVVVPRCEQRSGGVQCSDQQWGSRQSPFSIPPRHPSVLISPPALPIQRCSPNS